MKKSITVNNPFYGATGLGSSLAETHPFLLRVFLVGSGQVRFRCSAAYGNTRSRKSETPSRTSALSNPSFPRAILIAISENETALISRIAFELARADIARPEILSGHSSAQGT
jgi:hypothetical protein